MVEVKKWSGFSSKLWPLLMVGVLLSSCGGATKNLVVMIPAINTNSEKSEVKQLTGLPHSVAVLPFINRTKTDAAFEVVRRTMFNHFASKNYRALHWKEVDARLQAAGLADATKLDGVQAASLASTLGVDGLLYGEITHYDKTFLGIYAQVAVGVRLRLVDRSGKEIWQGEDVVRSHAGGISTTPIGLIMNAVAAAYHTAGNINLYRAADELGRNLIVKIPEPARLKGKNGPKIIQIVHDGVGRILKYGDTLSIALEGEPGRQGFARIDGFKTIDLVEGQAGFYTAKYNVAPSDNIDSAAVVGVLADASGAQSEWISPLGLLTIDNTPPGAPKNSKVQTVQNGLNVSWDMASEKDVVAYQVMVSDHAQGPFVKLAETKDVSYIDTAAKAFSKRYYRIVAIDHAANRAESATITAQLLLDARLASATELPETLPATVEGISVLRSGHSYQLSGITEVTPNAVLLIEPGVRINAGARGSLKVFGALQAFGSSEKPIRINGGNQVLVLSTEKSVKLDGLIVDGAAIAITVTAGAPEIADSTLIHNRYSAMEISGVSRPVVRNCRLEGASSGGVLIMGKAQPRFTGTSFKGMKPFHIQSMSPYRIDARHNKWEPAPSASTIMGDVDYSGSGSR
ncbi:MAG: DUF799 family lipoprotein [Mariprofundus sp.]|nr:DUF799 family lipoprotein [Mariprofundus sp.]